MNKITPEELQTIIDTQKADIDELNEKLKDAEVAIASIEDARKTWIAIADEKDAKIEELKFRIASIKAVTAAI